MREHTGVGAAKLSSIHGQISFRFHMIACSVLHMAVCPARPFQLVCLLSFVILSSPSCRSFSFSLSFSFSCSFSFFFFFFLSSSTRVLSALSFLLVFLLLCSCLTLTLHSCPCSARASALHHSPLCSTSCSQPSPLYLLRSCLYCLCIHSSFAPSATFAAFVSASSLVYSSSLCADTLNSLRVSC